LQRVDLGGGGTAYYVYNAAGQRTRKIIEGQNGARNEERLYLGGFELYRKFGVNGLSRETLHIMDDKERVALVDTQLTPVLAPSLIRYQFGNHLGSASLELDASAGLISYEEYHPYGTTAFQTSRSAAEVSLKRYRYTSKERDEETGLAYHGARYYLPWLGRWASCDPSSLVDGPNLYRYCKASPINLCDPKGADPKGASEGSVLTGTIDPTLDKKGIGYNTETKLEITLRDGTVAIRRVDRFYQAPNGDWMPVEAKGADPEKLTPNETLLDKRIQVEGGRFRVLVSSGAPPPGHGQAREDIAFTKDFVGEIKPGNFQYVHGAASHLPTENLPATASAALWKAWMNQTYADAPGHENMVRKINPNAAPTWITPEQAMQDRARFVGNKENLNPVNRATGWMSVKPKDSFLSNQPYHPSMTPQIIAGTVVAGVVVTAPLWGPEVFGVAKEAPKVTAPLNRVRVALEQADPRFRVAEEKVLEKVEEIAEEGLKKAVMYITQ
jgi:RHS repeat-associated protein